MVLSIFYDLDGTIVGNVTPQVIEWHLVSRYQPARLAAFKAQLVDVLRHHLVRPGFLDFHHGMAEHAPHVQFFVYTASDPIWASVLVPCIEKALDIQFNRPIFTRSHVVQEGSQDMRKSLVRVAPLAHKALLKKGYQVSAAEMLRDAVLIDNNPVLISAEASRLISCPTYDYVIYQDVLRLLPLSVIKENMLGIQEELMSAGMFPATRKDMTEETFMAHYYGALHNCMTAAARVNRESRRDIFWKTLLAVAVGRAAKQGFKDSVLATINKKVQDHLTSHRASRR